MHVRTLLQIVASVASCALVAVLLRTSSIAQDDILTSKREPIATSPAAPLLMQESPLPEKGVPSSTKRRAARIAAQAVEMEEQPAVLPAVNKPGITPHHQQLTTEVLRTLPPHCRLYLENFYVIYNGSSQRGLGGKTTIILDGSTDDEEFASLLIHECAHVTHGNLLGSRITGESAFRDGHDIFFRDSPAAQFFAISWMTERVLKEDARPLDFVSGYAKTDAFEDFAETFAAYVLHRDMMRERAQTNAAIAAKLKWMETYLPLAEHSLGRGTYAWDGEVPWDITRLPLTLVSAADTK